MTNQLDDFFNSDGHHLIHKWLHYFEIYDRYFKAYKDKKITIVEFGVGYGGSLQMWKDYFGPKARIIGVDIEPQCKELEEEQIEIFIGDQADRQFLSQFREKIGPADIVIDDGGHQPQQQIATFEELWPAVSENGLYLIEDLHTSYNKKFGGGYKQSGTFAEYSKDLVDQMHAWYSRDHDNLPISKYTQSVKAMHIYAGMIVFEKGIVTRPTDKKVGEILNISFDHRRKFYNE